MKHLSSEQLDLIAQAIKAKDEHQLSEQLEALSAKDIADLLEYSPRNQRRLLWNNIDQDRRGEVLAEVNAEVQKDLITQIDTQELVEVTKDLDDDDLADILQDLTDEERLEYLQTLGKDSEDLTQVLSYPENTAGGLMSTDFVAVRPDVSLDVVIRYLRQLKELPDSLDQIYVVNRQGHYLGSVTLVDLIRHDGDLHITSILNQEIPAIDATLSDEETARIFETQGLMAAPVVDDQARIIGRITADDVLDFIRENADEAMMNMAGLDEESDIFAPVRQTVKSRSLWLGINLLTALLASWVIGIFDTTIEKVVALAVLMPIVASMGGIAGTQTLTIVIRALAVGKLSPSNARALGLKELMVGFADGVIWAMVIGLITWAWFQDPLLSLIIGIALVTNLVVAALAGVSIPLILHKNNIDPALAGGVILTTFTDVMGFFTFLGLATWLLI